LVKHGGGKEPKQPQPLNVIVMTGRVKSELDNEENLKFEK
jgi:hypothetical protein